MWLWDTQKLHSPGCLLVGRMPRAGRIGHWLSWFHFHLFSSVRFYFNSPFNKKWYKPVWKPFYGNIGIWWCFIALSLILKECRELWKLYLQSFLNMGLTMLTKTFTSQNWKAKLSAEVVPYLYLTSYLTRVPHTVKSKNIKILDKFLQAKCPIVNQY